MPSVIDYEQDKIWESVQTLISIDGEQAKTVLKVAIERSLQILGMRIPVISTLTLKTPSIDAVVHLKQIEKQMREAYQQQEEVQTYEWLVDYIDLLSQLSNDEPHMIRKRLLASLLSFNNQKKRQRLQLRKYRLNEAMRPAIYLTQEREMAFYTPKEVAGKLGLSDQTIRRMCDKGKFKGAYQTDGGHWKIPKDAFITTPEQDKRAETVLQRIDSINKEAGDVDEFNL